MPAKVHEARVRVVVIAPAGSLDQAWITALQADATVEVLSAVGVLKQGIEVVQQLQPNVVIIDRAVDEIVETMRAIYSVVPDVLCIGMLQQQDMAAMRRLVTAGARDILIKPIGGKEVLASLRQAVQLETERRERAGLPSLLGSRGAANTGKVIVLMGAKGGVGTTTIATNVAVALRRVTGKQVVLADFSLQFGDIAVLLNVWSKHTVHDLAAHYQTLDEGLLERVLTPHSSGIKVLQAPADLQSASEIRGSQVAAIVDALRARFAYVVIDCWSFVDDITETLLPAADHVLFVTTPEVPALKNTKQVLDYFVQQGIPRERLALVLNRFPSVKGIKLRDIEEHLRHPIQANLPSDGAAATHAANEGVPLVLSHPQSWMAQSFLKLAAWLAGDKVRTISEEPEAAAGAAPGANAKPAKRRFRLLKSST